MPRRLTGFTPSGNLHLGNYVGAMRPIITEQASSDTVVFNLRPARPDPGT
jgi:tryptophanyl-tRNA synthetase